MPRVEFYNVRLTRGTQAWDANLGKIRRKNTRSHAAGRGIKAGDVLPGGN